MKKSLAYFVFALSLLLPVSKVHADDGFSDYELCVSTCAASRTAGENLCRQQFGYYTLAYASCMAAVSSAYLTCYAACQLVDSYDESAQSSIDQEVEEVLASESEYTDIASEY